MISDETVDAIAHIELHRQEMAKEAGIAAACSEALRKLHELLEREREAPHGPGTRHAANIEALTGEIERVKRLAGAAAQPKQGRPRQRGHQRPGAGQQHQMPRGKQRRTMGRGRGR
jgi:bacterioferritin-associated ferredoxin